MVHCKSRNRTPILFLFIVLCGWYASHNTETYPPSLENSVVSHIIRAASRVFCRKINLQQRKLYYDDKSAMRRTYIHASQVKFNICVLYIQIGSYDGRFSCSNILSCTEVHWEAYLRSEHCLTFLLTKIDVIVSGCNIRFRKLVSFDINCSVTTTDRRITLLKPC